jgi:CRP-like cAMP-binding protein
MEVSTADALLLKLRCRDDVSRQEEAVMRGLLDHVDSVPLKADLIRDGDRPSHSTLLVSGLAGRYKLLTDGSRQITAIHVPGDFVDFHSLLLKTMDHGVVALTGCEVVRVPHDSLRAISRTHPHLMRLFSLCSLIDAAIHREWLVCMGRRLSTSHLAHLACEIYQLLESVHMARNFRFDFPITQTDLADMMGISTVHANRIVQELRHKGLIAWDGHEVQIRDWARLSALGEYDNTYLHLGREPR